MVSVPNEVTNAGLRAWSTPSQEEEEMKNIPAFEDEVILTAEKYWRAERLIKTLSTRGVKLEAHQRYIVQLRGRKLFSHHRRTWK